MDSWTPLYELQMFCLCQNGTYLIFIKLSRGHALLLLSCQDVLTQYPEEDKTASKAA